MLALFGINVANLLPRPLNLIMMSFYVRTMIKLGKFVLLARKNC
nr:MAG TPA: hypothetical protein [Caudoviricetes sp.]